MAERSPTLPSRPSVESDMASESFIVPSDSLTSVDAPPRPNSPTAEKQGLVQALDQAHSALARAHAENDDLKEQLATSQRQVQDQADQISMLRGKVEEARRGVMRLQTENRRHSQLAAAVNLQEIRTAKRASFILPPTPGSPGGLTPGGGKHIHRRISSMSDPGLHGELRMTASPPSFATSFPEAISGPVTPPGPSAEEFAKVRAELAACQKALQEATDSREASETAVRALREFIAENAVGSPAEGGGSEGLQGLRLPPLPTDADVADSEASAPHIPEEPKRGWGSWLKRENAASSTPKPAPVPVPVPALAIRASSEDEVPSTTPSTTPLTNFVSSWTRSVSSSTSADATSPATAPEPAPAQTSGFRKFSLFNRSSSSSVHQTSAPPSQTQTQCEPEPEQEEPKHIPPPLQLTQREGSVRDSVSSATVSDAPEPISPPVEMVDVALDRDRRFGEKEEFPGERTPTVGSATGFAM